MTHFDLAIIGTGSGNSLVTPDFDGKRVAIIESGTFGSTCMNVDCIPTKMYVIAADVANAITHAARYGIDATLGGAWAVLDPPGAQRSRGERAAWPRARPVVGVGWDRAVDPQ